jgi:hypothetical protein
VDQGSTLSPLLFNTVMNYLTSIIQRPLHADDVAVIPVNLHDGVATTG